MTISPPLAALAAAALLTAWPLTAGAQMAVIDVQQIAQSVKQVSQGVTQIQNLQAQLANQAQMLQRLQGDITGPLLQIAGQATGVLQQAQGLGYGAANITSQFTSTYPSSMAGASLASTLAALATWRQNNALALQQALQTQNQIAQGQPTTTAQVASAVSASQAAPGPTSAIQATNQLLAAAVAQLTQLQNLLITEARAAQTQAAQAQASQAAGAADSQRFWVTTTPASRVANPDKL